MYLRDILRTLNSGLSVPAQNPEITGFHYNSAQIKPGMIFIAIKGFRTDGHKYIDDAIRRGAVVVIGEDERQSGEVIYFKVTNSRQWIAHLASIFYPLPDNAPHLPKVAVTGTNGKTTTTYYIRHLMVHLGYATGMIGTIENVIGGVAQPAIHTTPEADILQQAINAMITAGDRYLAMEVSSHALALDRVHAIHFDIAAFTNLSPEHLDFHSSMDEYYAVKKRLFTGHLTPGGKSFINIDSAYGFQLWQELMAQGLQVWSVGTHARADYHYRILSQTINEASVALTTADGKHEFVVSVNGLHNVANAILAIVIVANLVADDFAAITTAAAKMAAAPGRLQKIADNIFVDYAHTPDGLAKALASLKTFTDKVTVVFGAGGNRDPHKRKLMGEVADKYADKIILTNDNPRNEDPAAIIGQIQEGILTDDKVSVMPNRAEAIARAISEKGASEIVLVAGKGHENFQLINGQKKAFNDADCIRSVLAGQDD
jgi:UDP-N-acetylmuramoyl-L-alanyl-D-glutamate--2,6-diaminopimelate ligase